MTARTRPGPRADDGGAGDRAAPRRAARRTRCGTRPGPAACASSSTRNAASSSRCQPPAPGERDGERRAVEFLGSASRGSVATSPATPTSAPSWRPAAAPATADPSGSRARSCRSASCRRSSAPGARPWSGSMTSSSSTVRRRTARRRGRHRGVAPRARPLQDRRRDRRHAAALGVTPRRVTIRDPRSRWGSASQTGRVSLSWRLVLAPREALETVVIHELAHLRVFGHGPRFWALVASRRPDHRTWRRWLHDHATELHGALG